MRHGITDHVRWCAAAALVLMLSGCGVMSKRDAPRPSAEAKTPPAVKGGGYYLDDGPGDNPPANLDNIPDAVPRVEPLHRGAMRPYSVMGRNYTPMTVLGPYKARGVASWYGRRYHGKQTSSGEIYDMYAMTAAHPTLPLPSYVRVTNLSNGRSVIVRVNDRGPFIDSRLIDLSYSAAYKLGTLAGGSGMVEVESLIPGVAPYGSGPEAVTRAVPPVASVRVPPATPAPTVPADIRVGDAPPQKTESAAAPERRIAVENEGGGIYLQLAAFGTRDNADAYAARLRTELAWLSGQLQVYIREGLFRVHAGPFAGQTEARAAADRISETLGIKPLVLVR